MVERHSTSRWVLGCTLDSPGPYVLSLWAQTLLGCSEPTHICSLSPGLLTWLWLLIEFNTVCLPDTLLHLIQFLSVLAHNTGHLVKSSLYKNLE